MPRVSGFGFRMVSVFGFVKALRVFARLDKVFRGY